MAAQRTILVVEDESSIREPLVAALDREGFATEVATTVSEALESAASANPDLVLLDVMLPDGSGFDVCRQLRSSSSVPIIMLTARGEEADRVAGLEIGADDYVIKPFSAREVIARIGAVLRRSAESDGASADEPIEIAAIRIDPRKRSVTKGGGSVELSRKEFDLLHLLMKHAGTVLERDTIIAEVWDTNWFGSTKTLDVHVGSVRKKLGDDPAAPEYLHTVRGVGFRFSGPDEVTALDGSR